MAKKAKIGLPWGFTETVSRIMDVALCEFGTKGFASTSTTDIAKKAGVSKQLLYHYFDGKRDIYSNILKHMAEANYNALLAVDYENLPPLEAIRQGFLALYDIYATDQFSVTIAVDQTLHRGEHIVKDVKSDKLRDELLTKLGASVKKGQEAGEISMAVNATSIHIMAVLLALGRFSFWPMLTLIMNIEPIEDDAVSRADMAEFYMRAIRA